MRKELALLQRTIDRGFADPEDRIIAGAGDMQGFGSRRRGNQRRLRNSTAREKEKAYEEN
jgi:hypothetical protein